jgi:hypothetical protein
MTTADDEPTAPRARCGPYLARLAVLADSPPGTPLPAGTAAEVAGAAGAVLTQAEQAVSAAAAGQQAAGEFLTARLARLKAAAGDAVTAARSGDAAALRACLRQFDALTSALWTVHEAVTVPAPRTPASGSPRRARPERRR